MKAGGTRLRVFTFVVLVFGFIVHIGWYLAATVFFIQNKIINDLDFLISYTASEIAKSAGYPWIYDTQYQAEIQVIIRGPDFFDSGLLPFNHPPFFVPLYTILLPTDYTAAYVIWQVVAILVLVGIGFVLGRLLIAGGLLAKSALPIALFAAVFYPTLVSIWKGQDTLILLGAVGLWALGFVRKDDRLAGLALALATIRPQIALGLAIPMLLARRKVFLWFVLGALVLGVYTLLLIGFDGVLDYLQILQVSAAGETFNINQQDMFNMLGLFMRLFPGLKPAWLGVAGWVLFFGGIAFASYLWWKYGCQKPAWYLILLSIVLVTFASPHLHYHDLSILVIPLVCLVIMAHQRGALNASGGMWLIFASSLVVMIADASPDVIRYTVPYVVVGLWMLGVIILRKSIL